MSEIEPPTTERDRPRGARISVAPMMAWTTPAQRYFMRQLTQRALLYTEMVTANALIHGDTKRFLALDPAEHPVALQLGGSEPADMAYCAALAEEAGFDEVNINVGCPSERVQTGAFGACLMAEPERIANCVAHMKARVSVPVTVKTRIGIDHQDSYAFLVRFAACVRDAGADRLIVHARKAWLSGLSPKENRDIPPLDYARVHQLAADFPDLPMSINGGFVDLDSAIAELDHVDGVMIGREAYRNPYVMADVDQRVFDAADAPPSRVAVVAGMRDYIGRHLAAGGALRDITHHMLGLFHAQPGGRNWRRILSERGNRSDAGLDVLDAALAAVAPETVSAA
ncbi:tRNA dihydrouridine(20/20a) synthase DusA [Salinisphaera sp. Q1T1-3]|uniref:tRNA dihydrouridine(20/20a) synthase DusA n=1 Tax=Salinisphaera sp. Q1T1-3 TaxID=2321229 RepID=UPI000E74EADD|nr:tRNA dihydrouridine(20/20a) synthase DusA [Salinisphaera sp. Q1T1-3]RJS95037.1 tRNA dihydrouridine(20/20a) synthase DusA [Salinisphaera sp. Q1T1-3]